MDKTHDAAACSFSFSVADFSSKWRMMAVPASAKCGSCKPTLSPNLLPEAVGVADINDWGATFTTTSTIEVNATGTSLRTVTRVGKFCNCPNCWRCPGSYTDVVTRGEVPIALPQLADGQRRIISITPHQTARRCCRMSSVNLVAAQQYLVSAVPQTD